MNAFLKQDVNDPDDVRMTLGEHLEELRTRVIRALAGLVVGAIICYVFIDDIVGFLMWPVFEVLKKEGHPVEISYFNVAEPFFTELKLSIIVGLIISAPFSLAQIWGFVAAGLYPNERKWVRRFAPVSIALFFTGAAFLLLIVSPLLVRFLLTYRESLPDFTKTIPIVSKLVPSDQEDIETDSTFKDDGALTFTLEQWTKQGLPRIPVFDKDPKQSPDGGLWLSKEKHEIRTRYGKTVYVVGSIRPAEKRLRLRPTIRLGEHTTFVLHLAGAFGLGFQVPVVVAFIAVIGAATSAQMGKARRYVWFGMAIGSAMITPPDVTSMVFLLGPMVLLYEAGLLAAKYIEREAAKNRESES